MLKHNLYIITTKKKMIKNIEIHKDLSFLHIYKLKKKLLNPAAVIHYSFKNHIYTAFIFLFIVSCGVNNRILEINDEFKEIKSYKLLQNPTASSSFNSGSSNGYQTFTFSSAYIYEENNSLNPLITLEIKLTASVEYYLLDTVFYLMLDGEKIKLKSRNIRNFQFELSSKTETSESTETIDKKTESKDEILKTENKKTKETKSIVKNTSSTTTTTNYQTTYQEIIIPENLWISMANASKIKYRLYMGRMGIDVNLSDSEIAKIKEFCELALKRKGEKINPKSDEIMKW